MERFVDLLAAPQRSAGRKLNYYDKCIYSPSSPQSKPCNISGGHSVHPHPHWGSNHRLGDWQLTALPNAHDAYVRVLSRLEAMSVEADGTGCAFGIRACQ